MNNVIYLDNVSLWRRTQEEFSYDLKKTVLSIFEGRYTKPKRKLVINSINLCIQAGDKVGIIGSNGAGKSTLLKIICGILKPTQGTVKVKGTISPLIELGAGFDSELSVVDNIFMYGIMLGLSRHIIEDRIKSILEFAELEDYCFSPVKSLSSGMVARLGFAVATDVRPDILILDEVLSVGDERFKNRCSIRINQLWDSGATIVFVSHSMESVKSSCDSVIWLDQGQIKSYGSSLDVIHQYLSSLNSC